MLAVRDALPDVLDLEASDDRAIAVALATLPEWLLDSELTPEPPPCELCGRLHSDGDDGDPSRCPLVAALARPSEEPEGWWAIPGVTGLDVAPEKVVPSVGERVARIAELVTELVTVDPARLSAGQALGEAGALAEVQHQLRVAQLARTADVKERKLYEHLGYRSVAAWQSLSAPDAPASDRRLADKLARASHLASALDSNTVSFTVATLLSRVLSKVEPHLDRPDGLVDDQPAEQTLTAVGWHVVEMICKDRLGLEHDPATDPEQAAFLRDVETEVQRILSSSGSQCEVLEQLLVVLGAHVRTLKLLKQALEDITFQLLPTLLDQREQSAQDKRALSLSRNSDGTWHLEGTLTPEVGEQAFTALAAEARRDPANPLDTHARAEARAAAAEAQGQDGWAAASDLPEWEARALRAQGEAFQRDVELVPRSRSKRLHDALGRLLTRYLEQGLGGTHGKVPVQIAATVSDRNIEGAPGAPPARGATGQALARSLLRRWWCDAHVTVLLMSSGWKPLGVVHSSRTITGTESKALMVQYDNRCPGIGCCPGEPDPLIPLVPHHIKVFSKFGRTTLEETLPACPVLHDDIHLGKRTIRLRDGRLITEDGYLHEAD